MEILKRQMKIIDCFLYWNEIDTLLLRLHELDSYVSNFVIVEFDLNFKLNRHKEFLDLSSFKFERFRKKISHLKVDFKNYDEDFDTELKKINSGSLEPV